MFNLRFWLIYVALLSVYLSSTCAGEDYYEMLGIAKSANNREIRKAFKKLAVKLHPDKNKDDPNAHGTFIKLTKAYETLKDEELRKKYDLYGEDFKDDKHQSYQSWSYYHDNFGIYDEDPEIITLNRADFEQSVVNSNTLWFINFYSPMCSHCHHLAPAWRQLARAVEGVVRIGAVNCEEDWLLCQRQSVHSYPSLVTFPAGQRYKGELTAEAMERYILNMIDINVVHITFDLWHSEFNRKEYSDKPWLLFLCYDDEECAEEEVRVKVASILEGLVNVGIIDCMKDVKLCALVGGDTNIVFWEHTPSPEGTVHKMKNTDFKDIARQALSFLPEAMALNKRLFYDMREQLQTDPIYSWLVYFYLGSDSEEDLELKKLPALLPTNMHIGKVHCGKEVTLCQEMYISRYPVFAVFKPGGNYEFYHGRETAHDIANFAEESRSALNIGILTPEKFEEVINSGGDTKPWFVDFYAPWCPPCMRFLPEFRKASHQFEYDVKFGTVDCTVHVQLCRQYNIRSYPTTILYNNTIKHQFHGGYIEEDLVDFIDSYMNPLVVNLTASNFYSTVAEKSSEEIWVVDFYAPWCGACQQLSPNWRKLAKILSHLEGVHVGEVDCQAESNLCDEQSIRSYPTIRLYPTGSQGLNSFAIYGGYQRDTLSLKRWVYNFIPSTVEEITSTEFLKKVMESKHVWLIDFYTTWCGHCNAFLPEFQEVARLMEGQARTGKVNCEIHLELCQKAQVRAYPTVMLYVPWKPASFIGEEIESQASHAIVKYVQDAISKRPDRRPHDEF